MEFLNHLVKVFKDYFGVFDEERIRYLLNLRVIVVIISSLCMNCSMR